jgi:hypothetical protein
MEMNDLIKEAIWNAKIYRFSVYEDDAGHLSIDVPDYIQSISHRVSRWLMFHIKRLFIVSPE